MNERSFSIVYIVSVSTSLDGAKGLRAAEISNDIQGV